jgi:hypothetical protein
VNDSEAFRERQHAHDVQIGARAANMRHAVHLRRSRFDASAADAGCARHHH